MRSSKFANAVVSALILLLIALPCEPVQAAPPGRAADQAEVAWLRDGAVQVRPLIGMAAIEAPPQTVAASARDAGGKVPLGSLWKLFVYAYLAATQAQEPAYVCAVRSSTATGEERYCCDPGESVERDAALSRSCAPYFEPARLGLTSVSWRAHWQARTKAKWLLDYKQLQPETEVKLGELLLALAAISPPARNEARKAMLDTAVLGYGREAWTTLGTGIRYKTYSWHRQDGTSLGGAAGWLADGTPFWFGARGSSRTALTKWATQLASTLPPPRWKDVHQNIEEAKCVDVNFFARYPLRAVWRDSEIESAKPGAMNGRYRLQFTNGNLLRITSQNDLNLTLVANATPVITGRFGINDYVARVIDREGSAQYVQAARALAIAARTYLVQNAHFEGGCWRIADTSATQRVSPNQPSEDALAAAWFTDEIVLNGAPVRYHKEAVGDNRLAWSVAKARAAQGWNFERILSVSYPKATMAALSGRLECARLDAAETWLASAAAKWGRELRNEPGFEAPSATPRICSLGDGHPYSDQQRLRIYVRGWRSLDERVTLAHEYLHIALRFHPNGANEDYIEHLARRLIEG